jgi:mRNA interferase YafQ
MKYTVKHTNAFKKDFKRAKKRGLNLTKLKNAVDLLANGEPLPESLRDHPLTSNWAHHRECHLAPDWLLIYQIFEDVLILELTRTGSHADLLD